MKQNRCKIIGITGGIASGKSTVSDILRKKGYTVIDADDISREVTSIGEPAYEKIHEYFGDDILREDLSIDRKKLGSIIFGDEEKRKKLNEMVHPEVYKKMIQEIRINAQRDEIIFLDIPLLVEEIENSKKYGIEYDEIWLVFVSEKEQRERLMMRDKISSEEAEKRIKSQMSMDFKRKYATRLIDNQYGKEHLTKIVEKLVKSL